MTQQDARRNNIMKYQNKEENKMLKLYNEYFEFVDWGVPSQADSYVQQGYIVEFPMKERKKDGNNS